MTIIDTKSDPGAWADALRFPPYVVGSGREVEFVTGRKLRVLDTCAGVGGFSLGLDRTGGFETVAFCEIDPDARRVLAKHWPRVPIYEDLRNLADQLAADGIAFDVITGGFPCQDLSTSGSGAGLRGARSGLWFEYPAILGRFRPGFLVLENSTELLDGWLGEVLGPLAALGYHAEWECIPASAVGAPHRRDRFWLIAHAASLGLPKSWRFFDTIHPTPDAYREADHVVDAVQRRALPFVCGRHDGFSPRLGQAALKQLGNAVTPPIPELIGNAILQSLNDRRRDASESLSPATACADQVLHTEADSQKGQRHHGR